MKISKLFIPGAYEDAFLYKGWLLAVTVNRSVNVYDLRRIVNDLSGQIPQDTSFLPMLFLNNNQLSNNQFKTFMGNEVVFSTFCSFLDSLPNPIEIRNPQYYLREQNEIPIETRAILDLNIYKDRLYLGLDKGCFQQDLYWSRRGVKPKGPLVERFGARCMGISTGYGSLNLSCGDEGLFTSADIFDWDQGVNPDHELINISSSSLRSSWMKNDLMNYSSQSHSELFRGKRSGKIVQFGDDRVSLDDLLIQVKQEHDVKNQNIQFSFNSDNLMFIHTFSGYFFAIEVKPKWNGLPQTSITNIFKGSHTQILSAENCRSGTVIETDDRVFLFSNGHWETLLNEEVIALRTFPDQGQFKDIVLAVTEKGIMLINIFDEEPHQRRQAQRNKDD